MTLSLGDDVLFQGPALPEAFVRHELEKLLGAHLPKPRTVQGDWEKFRKSLRQPLTLQSGRWRIKNVVLDPRLLTRQGDDGEKPSKLEALLDAARLKQGQITKDLRLQARRAVEQFSQGVLDHPANRERFLALGGGERERLAQQLWREA